MFNWEELKDKINFYRPIDNWHKHPWVSRVMCRMGRHDYTFDRIIDDGYVRLKCFYCEHLRQESTYDPDVCRTCDPRYLTPRPIYIPKDVVINCPDCNRQLP